ncbi:MAG: lipoate--protein ligase family protein [Verrucomicrobiales bacterium]|nr:lipoate--protein ligase family protein [Verrucomicrobiales bacterium]
MKYLDLSLTAAAANLACDEVLLNECESGGPEVLRVWEPRDVSVVVGYANRVATEVRRERCRAAGIPVLRRLSGGGTVVQMPGVLNYTTVLRAERPEVAGIPETNAFVLDRVARAVGRMIGKPVIRQGDTDLCLGPRKFSGNAQRRLRRAILFHGAILLAADLDLMDELLRHPSREPAYRGGRGHREFVMNLGGSAAALKAALRSVWEASEPPGNAPYAAIDQLMATRYSLDDWNLSR